VAPPLVPLLPPLPTLLPPLSARPPSAELPPETAVPPLAATVEAREPPAPPLAVPLEPPAAVPPVAEFSGVEVLEHALTTAHRSRQESRIRQEFRIGLPPGGL
jgi:hypothetical protein